MKTERQIIDELGEWLCSDLERTLKIKYPGRTSMTYSNDIAVVHNMGERIKYYRDNFLKEREQ